MIPNFQFTIFRKKYSVASFKERLAQEVETAIKCAILLMLPVPFTAAASMFWYLALHSRGIHFSQGMEGITTAAWIPTFGILYGLLAAIVLSTVWNEYKSIRTAVKRYDVETFIDLRDEEMSPLVHILMFVLSGAVLGAFMLLNYPDVKSGLLLVTSTSYLFSLIYYVVVEIDDPCSGIWFIKNIHEEWLTIDTKDWRQKRLEKLKAARNNL